ncbi:MAG: hypothetical protein Q4C29_02020 [bacterium]|nr:hypothetical protein [bacterium]
MRKVLDEDGKIIEIPCKEMKEPAIMKEYEKEVRRKIKVAESMIKEGIKAEDITRYTNLGVSVLDELYLHYEEDKNGKARRRQTEIAKYLISEGFDAQEISDLTELDYGVVNTLIEKNTKKKR